MHSSDSATPTDNARFIRALTSLRSGAKRKTSDHRLEAWYPYYAGFSLEFAEAVLAAADLPKGATVLDPWNGSGTTTFAASRLGLRGYGIDLNPFAVLVARARLVRTLDARGVRGLIGEVAARAPDGPQTTCDPLGAWLSAAEVGAIRRIQREILLRLAAPDGAPLAVDHDLFPPLASFLLLALVRAARAQVRVQPSTNPTTFRATQPRWRKDAAVALAGAWRDIATRMGDDLLLRGMSSAEESKVLLGDARSPSIAPETIDFVLTSPPYCTRLDYGKSTHFELAVIAPESLATIASLRRELMGAPLVRAAGKPEIPSHWPLSIRKLMDRIRSHRSKASDSYYFKTYHQYFSDADAAIGAIATSLKIRGSAALVVQGSYYKEIKVDLPSLYSDIAERHCLKLRTLHRVPVRKILSTIHPGTPIYRRNWSYDESLVLLRKEKIA